MPFNGCVRVQCSQSVHVCCDYLVEDDTANGFLFPSLPAADIFNLPIEWVWLIILSAALSIEWSIFPSDFIERAPLFKQQPHNRSHRIFFMFITEKCLRCSSVANVNNNSNIELFCVCMCAWFYYFGFVFWSNFHLIGWHTAYVKAHLFTIHFLLDWIENGFSVKRKRKSTPFAAYLDIWSLWCVCLIFHYVCSYDAHDKYVYTTHIQYGHDAMKRWLCSGDRLKMKCSFDQQFNNNNSMANYDFTMARIFKHVGIRSQNLFVSWPSAYLSDKCKIAFD